jgi:hypothetical protein
MAEVRSRLAVNSSRITAIQTIFLAKVKSRNDRRKLEQVFIKTFFEKMIHCATDPVHKIAYDEAKSGHRFYSDVKCAFTEIRFRQYSHEIALKSQT